MSAEIYQIPLKQIDNKETSLKEYQGKVLLIVNVASKCGLTPQYEGLEKMYEKYKDKNFVVLGFPANEFAAQEPGTNEEIKEFCETKFNIKFPLFSKIVVKGEGQHPLYKYLTHAVPTAQPKEGGALKEKLKDKGLLTGGPSDIMWNFEKFLVDRTGTVVARFAPDVTPDDAVLTQAVEKLL
jgi:glutathione peroxidase